MAVKRSLSVIDLIDFFYFKHLGQFVRVTWEVNGLTHHAYASGVVPTAPRVARFYTTSGDYSLVLSQILSLSVEDEVLDTRGGVWFTGVTEEAKAAPGKETTMTKIDQVALDVIDAILAEDGTFTREAGQVLHGLADSTGHDYKAISLAVLYLEQAGFVSVDRQDHPEAHRANRLVGIRLI